MLEREQNHNLDLKSEEVQDILSTPPSWIVRWGILLILIFTLIILSLSFLIKYPDFIKAKVLVTTKQATEKVIARNSGQLVKIMVNNKDHVVKNQRLAIIENTAKYADVFYLETIIDTTKFNTDLFTFPLTSMSKLVLGEIEPAYIEFEKNYINYNLLKELKPYENELSGNKESIKEVKNRLESINEQKSNLSQQIYLKRNELIRYQKLFAKGVISQQELELKEMEFLQMNQSVNSMTISASQMREAISSANRNIKSTYINKHEDDTKLLKNLLQSINSLKRAISDWEYKYVLASSINGNVNFQDILSVNQQVSSGDVVFAILPTNRSELIGKLTIPSQNAGKVKINQKVFVKLDNYPYQQYGMLIGNVQNISVSPDNNGNYIVSISLPNGTSTSYHKKIEFNQELIGNAEIITEDLSVAQRIFYRMKEIFKY